MPLLVLAVIMLLFKYRYTHQDLLAVALVWYVLAKSAGLYDSAIFSATRGLVSSHNRYRNFMRRVYGSRFSVNIRRHDPHRETGAGWSR